MCHRDHRPTPHLLLSSRAQVGSFLSIVYRHVRSAASVLSAATFVRPSVTACLKPLNRAATVNAPPVTATLFRTACPVVLSVQHTGWYVIFRSAINPFQSLRRHVQELNRKKNMSQSLTYAVASCDVYGVPLAVLIPQRSLEFWQVFLTEHVRRH